MFGKSKNVSETQQVQVQHCQCGGINMCFGNVTVHMKKEEFIANAQKIEKAKNHLLATTQFTHGEMNHEIH